jgi:hypothetical protein
VVGRKIGEVVSDGCLREANRILREGKAALGRVVREPH